MIATTPDWADLRHHIAGDVILPGSPAYEAARKPAIARFHAIRPQAVVRCATPADVAATIAFARRSGLPVVPRAGGHCFAGRSSTEGIVIDVSPMNGVSLAADTVTVGAGARLGSVYDALAAHGRTIAAGCGPEVGIAGLTLGGGLGLLGRTHGLTSDNLLAAEVVPADGRIITCDDQHDADLFWALRGAGNGTLGVVTSLVFRTFPAPDATGFHLVWPATHAPALLAAWQEWAPDAPDALAASLLLIAPAAADQPPRVHLFGAMLGAEADARAQIATFVARVKIDPTSAELAHRPYRETKRYLVEHGPDEAPSQPGAVPAEAHLYSTSQFFARSIPRDAIAAIVNHFVTDRVPGQGRELDLSPWGGAYNRVPADATAFVHRAERFLLKHTVEIPPGAASGDRDLGRHWLARSAAAVHPWGTGRAYQNFPDPELDASAAAAAYYGTNLARLRRVKATYDPANVFDVVSGGNT